METDRFTGWFTPTDGNCEDVDASCNISRVSGCFHGMRNSLTFTFFTKLTCYIGKCGSNSQGLTWVFWQTAGYVKTALFSFILKIYISLICNCEIGLFIQWSVNIFERRSIWDQAELSSSFQSWEIVKNVRGVKNHLKNLRGNHQLLRSFWIFLLFMFFFQ